MAVDFSSEAYLSLTKKEKLELAIQEFQKCSESFEYYVKNYAYVRHPNAGVIKMEPFDFQLDVAVPISEVLKHRRSKESIERLKQYKYKFDYKKWWNRISEKFLDMSKYIPTAFHEFYKTVFVSPDYHTRVDTIILKSRQTGISTIFQQLCIWHINFTPNVADIVLSKTDREAKKFLKDASGSWELIPGPLKTRKMIKNEHELWVSLTGSTSHISGMQVLPPTPDAGRSFDPNLVVLDEFATYRNAEEVWAAVSMCVSAGGIIVIISTPKGVGNLYHKIWTATKKSLISVSENPLTEEDRIISAFRPVVIHWSQLPEEEFQRRGFDTPLDWYRHMRAKLAIQGGEKLVAQELDLDFIASGSTIDVKIIQKLEQNALEKHMTPTILEKDIPGLIVYEPPQEDHEYIIGVDTSEGIGQDYHSFHVLKVPKDNLGIPEVVALFTSNSISIKEYKERLKKTAILYNNAWLNIERNNYGHTLLVYFIEEDDYIPEKILNKYNVGTNTFSKDTKGWMATHQSRTVMLRILFDFLTEFQDLIRLPSVTVEEFKTFVQNRHGKWEHQPGYHDDNIISLALSLVGYTLLPKYKQFLQETAEMSVEVDSDSVAMTSVAIPETADEESLKREMIPEKRSWVTKDEFDPDEVMFKYFRKKQPEKKEEPEEPYRYKYKPLSSVSDLPDDDIETF